MTTEMFTNARLLWSLLFFASLFALRSGDQYQCENEYLAQLATHPDRINTWAYAEETSIAGKLELFCQKFLRSLGVTSELGSAQLETTTITFPRTRNSEKNVPCVTCRINRQLAYVMIQCDYTANEYDCVYRLQPNENNPGKMYISQKITGVTNLPDEWEDFALAA